MNEVAAQMAEMMAAKVIEAIDGFQSDDQTKREIADEIVERLNGYEPQ
jgi:hypothetical protein